jgi:hypothetical protein
MNISRIVEGDEKAGIEDDHREIPYATSSISLAFPHGPPE